MSYFSAAMTNNKNKADLKFFALLILLLPLLSMGCTKHYAANITQVTKPSAAPIVTESVSDTVAIGGTLGDTLTGIWKLDKIEIPGMLDNMTSFTSQNVKDDMNQRLNKYQEGLKGLTVTFDHGGSYQSVYSGQSDVGTWKVNDQREIITVSKVTSGVSNFEILSVSRRTLLVKYNPGDGVLLLTLLKK